MTRNRNVAEAEATFSATWLTLARWSTWLVLVVGAVAIAPPTSVVPHVPGVIRFTLAVLVGLMILPMNRWKRRRDARRWGALAATACLLVVAMFFVYTRAIAQRTATYAGDRVAIGSVLTDVATEYLARNPATTTDELLNDAAGDRELIWTRDSIIDNEQYLAALYLALALLVAVTVLATVQVLACGRVTVDKPPDTSGAAPAHT